MDAILGLLKAYGLPDPTLETVPGQFSDPHLSDEVVRGIIYSPMEKGGL